MPEAHRVKLSIHTRGREETEIHQARTDTVDIELGKLGHPFVSDGAPSEKLVAGQPTHRTHPFFLRVLLRQCNVDGVALTYFNLEDLGLHPEAHGCRRHREDAGRSRGVDEEHGA